MKWYLLCLLALAAVLMATVPEALAQSKPEFKLGFKALVDQIPTVVGEPLTNEQYGANGDSLQRTSTGLMVWRKADNWTAFTNGSRTWVNGPQGIAERANTERFEWEAPAPGDDIEVLMSMRDILAVTLVDTHILPASPLAGRPVDRLQLTLDYDNVGNVGIESFTGYLNISDRAGSGYKRVKLENQRTKGTVVRTTELVEWLYLAGDWRDFDLTDRSEDGCSFILHILPATQPTLAIDTGYARRGL